MQIETMSERNCIVTPPRNGATAEVNPGKSLGLRQGPKKTTIH